MYDLHSFKFVSIFKVENTCFEVKYTYFEQENLYNKMYFVFIWYAVLHDILDKKDTYIPEQFGFRAMYSTQYQQIRVVKTSA